MPHPVSMFLFPTVCQVSRSSFFYYLTVPTFVCPRWTEACLICIAYISSSAAVVPKDLPESGDGETACPEDSASAATDKTELQSTSAVLGNIQESMNQSFLEMLVENIMNAQTSASPTASQRFSLEILPDISMAIVTFQNVKGKQYNWGLGVV